MEEKIKQVLALEESVQKLLAELKKDIGKAVHCAEPLTGVVMISEMPNCAAVSFSALRGTNLAPSTYLPCEQAAAVMRRLASKPTAQSVLKEVNEIVESRMVYFLDGDRITFNENTIQALLPYAHFSGRGGA